MADLALKCIQFFEESGVAQAPCLFACSGGVDSLSIYQIAKSISPPFKRIVLHIDHGWRKTSHAEAKKLQQYVEAQGDLFLFYQLDPPPQDASNLEDICRQQRLAIYQEVYQEYRCQALILGHHANDQQEVILKRVMEGSHFSKLSGMKRDFTWDGMRILRPLLPFSKNDVRQWAACQKLNWIEDPSNLDERFLRGRMRTTMVPYLEKVFGKKFEHNLLHLGQSATELTEFMQEALSESLSKVQRAPFGWLLERQDAPSHQWALKWLLAEQLSAHKDVLSRRHIEQLVAGIKEKKANQWFISKLGAIYQDRGSLFYFNVLPVWLEYLSIKPGEKKVVGDWAISLQKSTTSLPLSQKGWKEAMQGTLRAIVPYQTTQLQPPDKAKRLANGKSLKRAWEEEKVPACLRKAFPLILNQKGEVLQDFTLTNQRGKPIEGEVGELHLRFNHPHPSSCA